MCKHGTKTTSFLPADGKGSLSLLASLVSLLSGGSVTRKHLFLYRQGDRSGLRKQKKKKGQASTLILATTSTHLPKPVSTDLTIKSDSVLTNPLGTFNVTQSLEGWPLNAKEVVQRHTEVKNKNIPKKRKPMEKQISSSKKCLFWS